MSRPPGQPISPEGFQADVRAGLTKPGQKELYSKYLYDDLGTALFEAITLLPEYGLTRADLRLVSQHAGELAAAVRNVSVVAELGSGSGEKAHRILPHFAGRPHLTYCPIDLSGAALVRCQRDLDDIPSLTIVPIQDSYLGGLAAATQLRRPGTSLLVLFLGSSIGNFEPAVAEDFLQTLRRNLQPGDVCLLSTDLVKDLDRMLAAYNDTLGVTAAFNLNLLGRINRELGADFHQSRFRHEAWYNDTEQRIEMHLRSTADQTVSINGQWRVELKRGETIWTESSYKFHTGQVRSMSDRTGLDCEIQWVDQEWPFAQSVLRAR
ncbi:MAG: L-histidine N(alpha)-methyltransferase [Acidobacteria bacterium]|nr:MAG: L-histidine N(alpha)-methyltransferase [Acidobacteriota bacterium]